MTLARFTLAAAAIALLASARISHADEVTENAKRLANDARTAYNLGEYGTALEDFRAAYKLKQDPTLLYNLAQCERQLHKYADAARSYRAYLREGANLLRHADREQLEKRIVEMDRAAADELARQPPTGTEPTPPAPKAVEPPAPQADVQTTLTAAAPPPKSMRRPWYKKKGAMTAAVVGVVGLAVGGVLMGQSASNDSGARNASTLPEQRRLWADGGTYQSAGIAVLAVGGAGILVAGVLFGVER